MSQLFTPVRIGSQSMPNRLVMAPMTRSRADDASVPDDVVVTYYAQRSSAGLIITEGVYPCATGKGYVRTPGILSSGSNQRQDEYGGSVANRARFVLEVLGAMVAEAGGDRVGIKISPEMGFNDISDAAPQETYAYLAERLRGLNLAYLHVALFGTSVDYHALLRPRFDGAYLIGGGLDRAAAENLLTEGRADATVFGGAFLANPDLPERFRQGAPLNAPDKATFYTPGARGYIDYPALSAPGNA